MKRAFVISAVALGLLTAPAWGMATRRSTDAVATIPVPRGAGEALQQEYTDFLNCAIPKNKALFADNNLSELNTALNSARYQADQNIYDAYKLEADKFHAELARQKALVGC